MTAHTPGPWRAEEGQRIYGDATRIMADGERIALVPPDRTIEIEDGAIAEALSDTAKDNARLIAAAPSLYEAVKRVDALLRDLEDACLAMPHARRPRWFRGVQDMIAVTDGALRKADAP